MDKLDLLLLAGGGGENQVNLLIFQWQALIYLARFQFFLSFWKIPNLILIELNPEKHPCRYFQWIANRPQFAPNPHVFANNHFELKGEII